MARGCSDGADRLPLVRPGEPDLVRPPEPTVGPLVFGRWTQVRCWWRVVAASSHPVVLREISGPVGPRLLEALALRGAEIRQGEVMVECLSSGRRRFAELDALGAWVDGPPPSDVSSSWGAADRARRRRAKFLADMDVVSRRGVRRGILTIEGHRFLADLAGELTALPR